MPCGISLCSDGWCSGRDGRCSGVVLPPCGRCGGNSGEYEEELEINQCVGSVRFRLHLFVFTSCHLVCSVAEVSEGHSSEVSRPRGAESVRDLGRHAVDSAQRERKHSEGEIQTLLDVGFK